MSYYRSPEWRDLIETWDEWWFETTEFVNGEGLDEPCRGYGSNLLKVIAGLHDLTRLDPQPVWDVYMAIDGWHRNVRPESVKLDRRKRYPIELIREMIYGIQLHQA